MAARNAAVVVIDTQKDFVEGGTLAVEGGQKVAEIVRDYVIPAAQAFGVPVLFTKDWHIEPGDHFASTTGAEPDFVDSWPDHCVAGTDGAEFAENFTQDETGIFYKGQYAASYSGVDAVNNDGITLPAALKFLGVEAVGIVGLAFDYCVKATALDLAKLGFEVSVNTAGTASVHPENYVDVVAELQSAGVIVWDGMGVL